jgi:MoaA/NifB/PqqE/SkfB family radical SAM enzyme
MSTAVRTASGPAPAGPVDFPLVEENPNRTDQQSETDNLPARLLAKVRQEHRLLSVHWELSHRCSERCRHCFLAVRRPGDRGAQARELTTAEGLALLDAIADLGALYVTFSGGEPLLRPDLLTLAAHARHRRLALRLYTNGQAVTPAFAAAFAALYPLAVAVSLYSTDPAIHDRLTSLPGSWTASVAALRLFAAQGVHTIVKTPLLALNAGEYDALADLAASLSAGFEADPIVTGRIAGPPAGRDAPLVLRMSDDQFAAVLRRRPNPPCCPAACTTATSSGAASATPPMGQGPQLCAIGRSSLTVDPYGRVLPCVEVRRPVGSVRRRSLAAIWHDTVAWEPYLRLSASSAGEPVCDAPISTASTAATSQGAALLPVCRTCAVAPSCVRCHGGALHATGSLYGASPEHCRAARLRAHLLQAPAASAARLPTTHC